MKELPINKIICGDALEVLKTFPSESIDMVMTSPPYWGLRDYGIDGQIGLESHPKEYIRKLVLIFREVKRVLKKTGSFYLNMGDTYFGSGAGTDKTNQEPQGKEVYKLPYGSCRTRAKRSRLSPWLQPKQLMLIPSRVAIALQEDGWILRNDICWAKPNAMPSSVKDRLNTTWEHVFHFVKARRYYYDLDAIREKHATSTKERLKYPFDKNGVVKKGANQWTVSGKEFPIFNPLGKNPGDVIKLSPKYIGTTGHSNRQGLNRPLDIVTLKAYKEYQEPIAKYLKKYIRKEHKQLLDQTFGKHKWRHWIRTDLSGASLPGVDDWWKLKEILKFDSTFDDKIKEVTKLNIPVFQSGRNPGDFWQITTKPFPEAHFAVYPEELCIKPIKSSCPRWICSKCGFIRERITEGKSQEAFNIRVRDVKEGRLKGPDRVATWREVKEYNEKEYGGFGRMTKGWTKCSCNAPFVPGVVLDPFCGSGTTCLVARKLGRNYIGIDLNPDYCKMARKRLSTIPARLEMFTAAKKFPENQT